MRKCPRCGSRNTRRRYKFHLYKKWRCRRCHRTFGSMRGVVGLLTLAIAIASIWFIYAQPDRSAMLWQRLAQSASEISDAVSTDAVGGEPNLALSSTSTPMPTAAPIAVLDRVATAVVKAIPTPAPTATLTPTVTPIPFPHLRHIDEKLYMLELINKAREDAGVPPVALGDNDAAQLHAESALANCFASHWGIDGLKPYMRYSLAGGYQSNGENGLGANQCYGEGYAPIESIKGEIRSGMRGWMGSPGHRDNILDKHHKKVNIGMAWNKHNIMAYQHFEGDYVHYADLPSIGADGILSLSGTTKNGAGFASEEDLGIQIWYDPPPHELTRGQLARTYAYCNGQWIASIRRPLTDGSFWVGDDEFSHTDTCVDPYHIPADVSAPPLLEEERNATSIYEVTQTSTVRWLTASRWDVLDTAFSVTVDIRETLREHREGVYTIVVWGPIGGESAVISKYSIFYGITAPDTYTPR